MKKIILNILLFICLFQFSFGQDRVETEVIYTAFLQNINIDAFNSVGFSDITIAQISELGSANPASMMYFKNISSGIGFEYATAIDYYSDIKIEKAKQELPSNFGFVYPTDNLRFGLSYHRKYSSFWELELIQTTILYPQGTGETWKASSETIIHNPSFLIAHSVNDLINDGDKLDMGVQLYWDFWDQQEKINDWIAEIDANSLTWKIGFLYHFVSEVSLGILFEKGIDLEGELKMKTNNQLQITPPDTLANNPQFASVKQLFLFKLPDKLSIGFRDQISRDVSFSSNLTIVFWKALNDIYQDQLNFSASTEIALFEMVNLSLGLYVTDRNDDSRDMDFYGFSNNATFFDLGVKAKINNFVIHGEILDSKYLTAEKREQIIYKLGISYEFNN